MLFCGVSLGWEVSLSSIKHCFRELLGGTLQTCSLPTSPKVFQSQGPPPMHIPFQFGIGMMLMGGCMVEWTSFQVTTQFSSYPRVLQAKFRIIQRSYGYEILGTQFLTLVLSRPYNFLGEILVQFNVMEFLSYNMDCHKQVIVEDLGVLHWIVRSIVLYFIFHSLH